MTVQEGERGNALALQIRHIEIPSLDLAEVIEWHCALVPVTEGVQTWHGPVRLLAKDAAALSGSPARKRMSPAIIIDLDLEHADARVQISLTLSAKRHPNNCSSRTCRLRGCVHRSLRA